MKKISFFDGFTSGTIPTESTIEATKFVDFASSAAYEAEYGSPEDGSAFFNTTTNLINYYTGSAWVALDATQPMTTDGDIITRDSGVPARLPIGNEGDVLRVASGAPAWSGNPVISARAYRSGSQSVVGNTGNVKVQLNAESWDLGGDFDSTTNHRLTNTSGQTIIVEVNAQAFLSGLTTGVEVAVNIFKNGGGYLSKRDVDNTSTRYVSISDQIRLANNDYIELYVASPSDGTYTIEATQTFMAVTKLA